MESAFGVDHGDFSKKVEHWTTMRSKDEGGASPGRIAAGAVFPGWHGAIAGKKGHKLQAAGHELAPAVGVGAAGIPFVGGAVGTNAAQNKGYYKGSKAIKLKKKTVSS